MDGNDVQCNLSELADTKFTGNAPPEDLFSIFEGLDAELARFDHRHRHQDNIEANVGAVVGPQLDRKQSRSSVFHEWEIELEMEPPLTLPTRSSKRPRLSDGTAGGVLLDDDNNVNINNQQDGQPRVSHIAVERNRRKQMNKHLTVLRSFMPSFYVKRGDQASIIGGVIDYINELQQVLQSLEAKKQRKLYTDVVLSPRLILSPRLSPRPKTLLSPRLNLPVSPRLNLPISPRTPQPPSPYKPRLSGSYTNSPTTSSSSSSINDSVANELAANSKSAVADVEVKLSGANLVLKTVSGRIPGQVSKIVYALEELSLEILHVNISSIDEAMVNYSFTIKIGIECQLSAEELAHQIQQTFHSSTPSSL